MEPRKVARNHFIPVRLGLSFLIVHQVSLSFKHLNCVTLYENKVMFKTKWKRTEHLEKELVKTFQWTTFVWGGGVK